MAHEWRIGLMLHSMLPLHIVGNLACKNTVQIIHKWVFPLGEMLRSLEKFSDELAYFDLAEMALL